MLLHFFSKALILLDLLLEVTFKDFKALRNFCKSVDIKSEKVLGKGFQRGKPLLDKGFPLKVQGLPLNCPITILALWL